jgi:hypothetical protein
MTYYTLLEKKSRKQKIRKITVEAAVWVVAVISTYYCLSLAALAIGAN